MTLNNDAENLEKNEADNQTENFLKAGLAGFIMLFLVIYWVYLITISILNGRISTCIFFGISNGNCIYAVYPGQDYFATLGLVIILCPIFLLVGGFFSLFTILTLKEKFNQKFKRKI